MRILCLIPNMRAGGAERVMAHLVSWFSRRHNVRLVTLEPAGTLPFYALPPSVELVQLDLLNNAGLLRWSLSIFVRFGSIRQQFRAFQPHVVLSFTDTMNIIASTVGVTSRAPVVISERVDPSKHCIGAGRSILRRFTYPLADACVVQTERVRCYFDRLPRPRVTVIPNPVVVPSRHARPASPNGQGRFRIIALGRLERQKGFDRLLNAFARIASSHPDWDLVIFGEGPDRKDLEAQIQKLNLGGRVSLPGITADPMGEFASSHIVAFPSRYEGFPNALAEGLAAGLPAVGFIGVSGVEDLIVEGETGLLVDPSQETTGLCEALKGLMDSADWRAKIGAQARRHMNEWQLEVICERWEAVLADVVKRKRA